MNIKSSITVSLKAAVIVGFMLVFTYTVSAQRITRSFDNGWSFIQKDEKGAEQANYNDASWKKLNVPHDWSIEGPYDQNNPTRSGGGYLPAGIGWYRKTFSLDNSFEGKKVFIEFDGVMAYSEVWINGHLLGKRPFGYISFRYDLSEYLNKGKPNVLAVRADNSIQPASRWYAGAGIYRHVRLVAQHPIHLDHWGVFITTPLVSAQSATVNIKSKVLNQSANNAIIRVTTKLIDPSGKLIKTIETKHSVDAGKDNNITQELKVENPALWYFDKPVLYKAFTSIRLGNKVIDEEVNVFGIRNARFEAATGFWLNEKNIKLKGVCLHHDGGAVGAAVPTGVWKRRLMALKNIGVNAIRTAHNPPAPEFLDLCDQLGFAVMDETFDTWTAKKPGAENGLNLFWTEWWDEDTRDMILRDRNHPSIVIYSVGNEIHDNLDNPEGFKKYKDQQDLIHQLDGTRPVTMALFRPNVSKVYANGFAAMMDIVGQNYRENELVAAHEAHPDWKVIGTENTHVLSMWLALRDKPYMAGQFLWSGIDYLGEARWPNTTAGSGLFTRILTQKQNGLQRESWWSDKPVVHVVRREDTSRQAAWVSNWSPLDPKNDSARLMVYSNCDEVELFLNNRSLGSKQKPADDAPRTWQVTHEKGTLKAVGKNKGVVVATEELKTAGSPVRIILSTDQTTLTNDWNDVTFVYATIVDANGVICANATDKINFTIEGPGLVVATDNGNISSHDMYNTPSYDAYRGKCLAIIRSTGKPGKVTVKAVANGISEGVITLTSK